MKNTRFMLSTAAAMLFALTPVFAQSAGFKVEVPFQFTVGKLTLGAGEYQVTVVKPGNMVLQLQRLDGPGTAAVMTTYIGGGPSQDQTPRLIFHNYAGHCFLSQVWIADVNVGHELFASASELEYARAGHQEQTVLLAKHQSGK
jgi:hypothetical protein